MLDLKLCRDVSVGLTALNDGLKTHGHDTVAAGMCLDRRLACRSLEIAHSNRIASFLARPSGTWSDAWRFV